MTVEIGVHLPQIGQVLEGPEMARMARVAEEIGFHSVWLSDHVVLPASIEPRYPYNDTGQFIDHTVPWIECLTTMSFVAGATSRIRIGSSVLIVPYRHAVVLGAEVAALQHLSGGRLILGVGVGWMKEEFEIMGVPYQERGTRLDESLEVIVAMSSASPASFEGTHFTLPPSGTLPLPAAPPEIWVGGNTPVALRRAARYQGWHGFQTSPDEVARAVKSLPAGVRRSVRTTLRPGAIDATIEELDALDEAGADHIVLDAWGTPDRIEAQWRDLASAYLRRP